MSENSCSDGPILDVVKKRKRLWPWFVVGFLIVFMGMGFTFEMSAMNLSRGTLISCNLFQYYYFQTKAWMMHSGELSTFNPSLFGIWLNLMPHMICATVGGAVLWGIGWGFNKIRNRSARSA